MKNNNFTYDLSHLEATKLTTKKSLLETIIEHDLDSFEFSFNTAAINYAIVKEFGMDDKYESRLIFEAGLFHDTGKLGMNKDFINYPGSYTLLMYNEMKKHTSGGYHLLKNAKFETVISETALYHHCNFDGSGYPGGLYGKEIPLSARITRISDSLDAYLSKRCYKEGGPAKEALDDLKQYNGVSYDPELIDCFAVIHNRIIKEIHRIGEDRPSQRMYMDFLKRIYLTDFPINQAEEVLNHF